jgi:hypothetical protein
MIYILEDNDERVRQFLAAAARIAPGVPVRVWRDAHKMIADLVDGLEHATVISLDHDLHRPLEEPDDPGSGYDVATVLGELIPCCRVIVHTSNGERGDWMVAELERGGWRYERVYPVGEDWIAGEWAAALRRCLE